MWWRGARVLGAAGNRQRRPDTALGLGAVRDHVSRRARARLGHVHQLEPEAHVRLVRAVAAHRLAEGQAREGKLELDSQALAPQRFEQALDGAEDVLLSDEAHLQVDLGVLGLAVGAQILVAQAARDLEVAVASRDHEGLLVELRRLRQGVELPRVDAARDYVVARALGRGLDQHRGLDLEEALAREVGARGLAGAVPERQHAGQLRAPQVEVAVAEPQVLVGEVDLLVDLERQRLGARQHLELRAFELDLAGRELRVHRLLWPQRHAPPHRDHPLEAQLLAALEQRRPSDLGAQHHLGDPVTVAQVDEQHPAVIAEPVHPAHHRGLDPGVRAVELAASVAAPPVAEPFEDQSLEVHHREGISRFSSPPSCARSDASSPARGTVSWLPLARSLITTSPRFHSSSPSSTMQRAPLLPAAFIWAPKERGSGSQSTTNSRRSSRTRTAAGARVSSIATTNTLAGPGGGAKPRCSSTRITRSSPIEHPTPGVGLPPSASIRPS